MSENQDYEMANGEEISVQTNGSSDSVITKLKDEERKLFVGGLSWETTERELKDYFSKFGEVESVNIKTDTNTGRSRGFSFVLFKDAQSIEKVFDAGDHVINNKKVDPKKAKLRPGKIFVGGLTTEITDEDIKEHFSQYGSITAMEMPFDKIRNQRKGFCFISFESDQIVYEIVKIPKQTIKGKMVDVKKATVKTDGFVAGARGRGMGGRGHGMGRGVVPAAGGYGAAGGYPMPDYSGYGYGAYDPYYGYGAAGYSGYSDYYAADPYGYGYDYSGYGAYDASYPQAAAAAPPPPPPPASVQPRGRGSKPPASVPGKRGARGFRHTPY